MSVKLEAGGPGSGPHPGWTHRDYYGNRRHITKEDVAAHNAGREEPTFNENYNSEKKLGTREGRTALKVMNKWDNKEPAAKVTLAKLDLEDRAAHVYDEHDTSLNSKNALNAGNAMTKRQHLDSCNAAMAATTTANEKNTADTHSIAASHHRIAAEHSKLMGKDDLFQKHTGMANAHDAAAARLEAASTEKNTVKAPDDYAKAISACSESTMPCPHCKKDVDTSAQDGVETGTVECPHCKQKFHTMEHVEDQEANDVKAATAYLEKANELSAKRMETKAPLMAGIAGEGVSLNDLNTSVREAVTGLPQFASPVPNSVGCAWVADIVAPEEEKGETWTAIVQGNDSKLYAVEFTIGDDSTVALVGDPKEVERTTDYDYVGEIETEAKAAMKPAVVPATAPIEAGDMSDKATKKSAAATALTAAAHEATKNAGDTKDGHTAASAAHKAAFDAHNEAYKAHAKAGSPDTVLEAHMDAMTSHKQHMADHLAACEACQAKTAADDLTQKVHACHAELMASGLNPSLDDLKHAVFNAHGILLKQAELAKHLSTKLEAGGPGSGPRPGKGKVEQASKDAMNQSAKANAATSKASNSGTKEDHQAAAKAHKDAFDKHSSAMVLHEKTGNIDKVKFHMEKALSHSAAEDEHISKSQFA